MSTKGELRARVRQLAGNECVSCRSYQRDMNM